MRGPGIADDASEAQPPLEMSHLYRLVSSLQNDISSKASSRPTTPTSAVINVSSDHDADEELQPRTKKRKEEKAKDKQKNTSFSHCSGNLSRMHFQTTRRCTTETIRA